MKYRSSLTTAGAPSNGIAMLSPTSILHGNCVFNRNNTVATQQGMKTYWLCKNYRVSMCRARCITHVGRIISATGSHNHPPHVHSKSNGQGPQSEFAEHQSPVLNSSSQSSRSAMNCNNKTDCPSQPQMNLMPPQQQPATSQSVNMIPSGSQQLPQSQIDLPNPIEVTLQSKENIAISTNGSQINSGSHPYQPPKNSAAQLSITTNHIMQSGIPTPSASSQMVLMPIHQAPPPNILPPSAIQIIPTTIALGENNHDHINYHHQQQQLQPAQSVGHQLPHSLNNSNLIPLRENNMILQVPVSSSHHGQHHQNSISMTH